MKQQLKTAILMTIVTTVICGLLYPAVVTLLAQVLFPNQANGELIRRTASGPNVVPGNLSATSHDSVIPSEARNLSSPSSGGTVIGSHLIGQTFTGDEYFHSRPSAAGAGYDPLASGGSNLGPTNRALIERVRADAAQLHGENPGAPVPVDLVTASGSGLDPDISPAAAEFQIPRVARARHMGPDALRAIVQRHTLGRQYGIFGEPRVNVLDLNLDLDGR
jgi:K+-transporting ATPase ATPase C chain